MKKQSVNRQMILDRVMFGLLTVDRNFGLVASSNAILYRWPRPTKPLALSPTHVFPTARRLCAAGVSS